MEFFGEKIVSKRRLNRTLDSKSELLAISATRSCIQEQTDAWLMEDDQETNSYLF